MNADEKILTLIKDKNFQAFALDACLNDMCSKGWVVRLTSPSNPEQLYEITHIGEIALALGAPTELEEEMLKILHQE